MNRVQSMFGKGFNSPAGMLVEQATSPMCSEHDVPLFQQVCSTISSYNDGSRDAVRAFKKRLNGTRTLAQVDVTISLIEFCVKRLGPDFHAAIATRDFAGDTLMKVINPKNHPPRLLEQRVLAIIRQLAEAYASDPSMPEIAMLYHELRNKGYQFPEIVPLKDHQNGSEQQRGGAERRGGAAAASAVPQPAVAVNLTPEQAAKLKKDVAVVEGNIRVFSEMLTEISPGSGDAADIELMVELNRTCRAMQQRIVELIGQVANEAVTVELLRVNDDLNNVFLRYERFEKFRSNRRSELDGSSSVDPPSSASPQVARLQVATAEPPPSYSDTEHTSAEVSDLIDLGFDSTPQPSQAPVLRVDNQMSLMSLDGARDSAAPAAHNKLSDELAGFGLDRDDVLKLGSNEKELEQWLNNDVQANDLPASSDHAVADEFSAFLNERAVASNSGLQPSPSSSAPHKVDPF